MTSNSLDGSIYKKDISRVSMQDLVFSNDMIVTIFKFLMQACCRSQDFDATEEGNKNDGNIDAAGAIFTPHAMPNNASQICHPLNCNTSKDNQLCFTSHTERNNPQATVRISRNQKASFTGHKHESVPMPAMRTCIFPNQSPSPFETTCWNQPSIVISIRECVSFP